MDLGLAGRRAIVTGATRGIGRATAALLAAEGCNVAICARNGDEVIETVSALSKAGVTVWGDAVDVGDADGFKAWIGRAVEALSGLDIFISNVSAMAASLDADAWTRMFETDLLGNVAGVEAVTPHLEKSDAGSIVFIATTAALEVGRGATAYSAMKAALINYMKGLARTYAAKGVRVNAVSPGTVYFEDGVWGRIEQANPDFFKMMLAENPTGRMARPDEVAKAAVFLASPASSFTMGTNLVVDGALTRRVQY